MCVHVRELHGDGDGAITMVVPRWQDCYSYVDLSELKSITEHLLTDNELFFSFVHFTVYTVIHTLS